MYALPNIMLERAGGLCGQDRVETEVGRIGDGQLALGAGIGGDLPKALRISALLDHLQSACRGGVGHGCYSPREASLVFWISGSNIVDAGIYGNDVVVVALPDWESTIEKSRTFSETIDSGNAYAVSLAVAF